MYKLSVKKLYNNNIPQVVNQDHNNDFFLYKHLNNSKNFDKIRKNHET